MSLTGMTLARKVVKMMVSKAKTQGSFGVIKNKSDSIYQSGNDILIDRNTNVEATAKLLSELEMVNYFTVGVSGYSIEEDFDGCNFFYREDHLKALLIIYLSKWPDRGVSFKAIHQDFAREYDEVELVKAIDSLMRAGLVVKAISGGLWWVGSWRSHCDHKFYLPYMSPRYYFNGTKMVSKRKVYGIKARKNYAPSNFYRSNV